MIDLKLTAGDITIENGDIALIAGVDEVAQAIELNLSLYKGEWFLDLLAGIPYFQYILIKKPYLPLIEQLIRNGIRATKGVKDILSLTFDYDKPTRKLSVAFKASSTEGVVSGSKEFNDV